MKFFQIKDKIKNLGNFKSVKEIKEAGLRICRNTKTGEYWLIEEEFLKPVIKSPRECKSIMIKQKELKYKVFMCHKSKTELKNTYALRYIEWGEKEGYHRRPTCKGRRQWWDLGDRSVPYINCNYLVNEIMRFYFCKIYVSDDFQEIYTSAYREILVAILNSTLSYLFSTMLGRLSFGGGLLKIQTYEVRKLMILNPKLFDRHLSDKVVKNLTRQFGCRNIRSIFEECSINPRRPIRDQEPNPLPDRKELDDIIFDILGLTKQERKEVYWAVCELVKNRLEKARSV